MYTTKRIRSLILEHINQNVKKSSSDLNFKHLICLSLRTIHLTKPFGMLLEPENLSPQTEVAQILNLNELTKITNYIHITFYLCDTNFR